MSTERASRVFIAALSVLALSAILGLVDQPMPRVVLGALIMGFLTWSAYTSAPQPQKPLRPPLGFPERRKAHTLRLRVAEFLRGIRRLHAIARDVAAGHVSKETGEKAFDEIERQLHGLIRQMRSVAGRNL